jgi:hypothetical protein
MRFGLVWWKDSTLEALAMLPSNGEHSNAANVGDPSEFDYVYSIHPALTPTFYMDKFTFYHPIDRWIESIYEPLWTISSPSHI